MENPTKVELTKEFFEELSLAIKDRQSDFIVKSLSEMREADISLILEEFEAADSKYVLKLLPNDTAANILKDLDEDIREDFLEEFSPEEVAVYLEIVETDNGADILNEMPIKKREEVLAAMGNEEKVKNLLELLRYEENCAGGLMAKELVKANLDWTVIQCIEEIRRQAENVNKIYSVYVVDNKDKLLGRVSLKNLLLSKTTEKVKNIYDDDIVYVQTYMEEEEIASIMQKYDLEVLPVINVKGKLVGRITVDDIIDVITDQAEQERQIMAGIAEDVEEDDNIWILSRARLPWLIIGLLGGMIGAKLISGFEEVLAQVTAVAFFIPLIIATGGNVGIQSSALVVQSLASHLPFKDSLMQRITKVFLVALINGVVLSFLVFIFIYFTTDVKLAIVVATALFSVVVLASLLGTLIPLILEKFGFNPALASGPFITTTIDLLGLMVYFAVAHFLYQSL